MYKRNTQPLNTKNCGCMFKNPRGLSAGALIDQAGLKGMRAGGAEVSEKHANFIIAHPGCLADDVMKLVKIIREAVYDKTKFIWKAKSRFGREEVESRQRAEGSKQRRNSILSAYCLLPTPTDSAYYANHCPLWRPQRRTRDQLDQRAGRH